MKLLSFTILMLFSFPSIAIEFYRCVDDKGQTHFTNLPKTSLDANCDAKNRYTVMLKQDYANLASKFKQYEIDVVEPVYESEDDRSVSQRVKDIFDSDEALDELLRSSEKDDNSFKRLFKARSEAVERVLEKIY